MSNSFPVVQYCLSSPHPPRLGYSLMGVWRRNVIFHCWAVTRFCLRRNPKSWSVWPKGTAETLNMETESQHLLGIWQRGCQYLRASNHVNSKQAVVLWLILRFVSKIAFFSTMMYLRTIVLANHYNLRQNLTEIWDYKSWTTEDRCIAPFVRCI